MIIPLIVLIIFSVYSVNSVFGNESISENVVINEVDINPPGDDSTSISEWVELYNPTDSEINLGGWEIASTTVLRKTMTIPSNTIIEPREFLTFSYQSVWFTDSNESVELRDENGIIIDKTPLLSDLANDFTSWQRIYDGYDSNNSSDWKFVTSTTGSSNGALREGLTVTVEEGLDVAGVGKTISIQVSGAQQIVEIKIIAPEGEIINTLSFPASSQGEVHVPWIIPADIEDEIYTIDVEDAINSDCVMINLVTFVVNYDCAREPISEYHLSDNAIKMFEKKIDRWNDKIEKLTLRVDNLESKNKYDRSYEFRAKIIVFESLVEYLENLIH